MPTFDLVDLLHQDGVENPSGHSSTHGIAIMGYFAAGGIKKPAKLGDDAATGATIGAIGIAHIFAAGKCMKKIYGSENKGDSKEDVVGDLDSQTTKVTTTIMTPGVKADYHAAKRLLNCSIGILFTSLADGTVMQYGSEAFPCHFKVSWASGNNEAYRGYTITATGYGDGVIYTPGLNFTPAV